MVREVKSPPLSSFASLEDAMSYATQRSHEIATDLKCLKHDMGLLVKKVDFHIKVERPMVERVVRIRRHGPTLEEIMHRIYQFIMDHLPFRV